jgi:hypothetical protein
MTGKLSGTLRTILVNAAVFAAIVEFAALGWYYGRVGGVYYLTERAGQAADLEAKSKLPFESANWRPRIHPYFGNIWAPESDPRAEMMYLNDNGFVSDALYIKRHPGCCDYPTLRGPKDFVIGVFGGSVAQGFALAAQRNETFVSELKKNRALADRNILVLNFAIVGQKQPQQAIILAYFLSIGQRFDAILNIDGFNETIMGKKFIEVGLDASSPGSPWMEFALSLDPVSGQKTGASAIMGMYYEFARRQHNEASAQCSLAACWAYHQLMARYYVEQRVENEDKSGGMQTALSLRSFFPLRRADREEGNGYEPIALRWRDASLIMRDLARIRGASYLHALQPNRYYKLDPSYVPADAAEFSYYQQAIPAAYGALQARIPDLEHAGVAVIDAARAFVDVDLGAYQTDCCHLSDHGNALFAVLLAARMTAPESTSPR